LKLSCVAVADCLRHPDDQIIVFNQYNEQTNDMYWQLLDVGIKARVIHSGISDQKRDEALKDFSNKKFNVLLTSRVLDEGYNLPSIKVAIIMAGDSTLKQTIQRMGRVLRKKDEQSVLYQIYCKHTIEEDQANERSDLFKRLSSSYNVYDFNEEDTDVFTE